MSSEAQINASGRVISPQASNAVVVTISDSTEFAPSTLYINSAGTIYVDMDGVGDNIKYVVNVGPFPYLVTRVYSTGTTITGAGDILRNY
ncbi:MAG: hypothetical protein H6743_03705 [Rickettsiaceae bacterium]|nr:hypothetical protein [Rickettsiaceae bacterium]